LIIIIVDSGKHDAVFVGRKLKHIIGILETGGIQEQCMYY